MTSVVNYCKSTNTRIHCIDQSIYVTAANLKASLNHNALMDILKYICFHSPLENLSLSLLHVNLLLACRGWRYPSSFNTIICNWLLTPERLTAALQVAQVTRSRHSAIEFLSKDDPPVDIYTNPFFSTTPRGYHRLCERHQLHEILSKVVISDRDEVMARSIAQVAKHCPGHVAVVVGENHVDGISRLLKDDLPEAVSADSTYPTLSDWFKLKLLTHLLH